MKTKKYLAVEIGNTRTKLAFIEQSEIVSNDNDGNRYAFDNGRNNRFGVELDCNYRNRKKRN